jgi:hypothetical protein
MKMSKQPGLTIVVAAALSAMGAASTRADTIYTYTGSEFTSASTPLTTSDFVTVTLDYLTPLPSNLSSLTPETPLSFSVTDGIAADTITNTTPGYSGQFTFITGASGPPIYWNIVVSATINLSFVQISTDWLPPTMLLPDPHGIDQANSGPGGASTGTITNTSLGSWSVATTPLPAALPLFATGLGAMGLFGWRRKRKAAASLATA